MPRYAAIDIGSNSVRLAVADVTPGQGAQTLAEDREVTRLGAGVFGAGAIDSKAAEHVARTLARFRQAYESHNVLGVRAVATSAVRDAANQAEFLALASEAAGTPVEVISGVEEARLVHAGVQLVWPHPGKKLLLIDIGGGSAEVIVSDAGRLVAAVSKPLGAVRLTGLFLPSDPPQPDDLERLDGYIAEKLAGVVKRTGHGPFDRVIATSATASAVVCAVNGIPRKERELADRRRASTAQIGRLLELLSSKSLAGRRKVKGIGPRRAEIAVAGTAVLHRILRAFIAPSVYYSAAGVRDGILADLAQRRVGAEQARLDKEQRRIVETMARRFGVDVPHARKTAELAGQLFTALRPLHELPMAAGKLLEAAAYLSNAGHYVSGMGHHKHSYYIVSNADLPAFTAPERETVAQLCRFHRKSMPSARHTFFNALPPAMQQTVLRLIPLLRMAEALDRSHDQRVEALGVELQPGLLQLTLASAARTNLEIWAGQKVAEAFESVYGIPVHLKRKSPSGN
jgi:exopolyphosphatase / guanosine-5'-triphosphate,3'-diphosphate pyrophosphatase